MITTKVTQVINKYDLEGLLFLGAPEDEYTPEIQAITAFVINNYKHINPVILADNIQFVFNKFFKDFFDYEVCEEMAYEIIIGIKGGF